jgi:hypothetical protein
MYSNYSQPSTILGFYCINVKRSYFNFNVINIINVKL